MSDKPVIVSFSCERTSNNEIMIGFVNPSLRDIQAFNNYCLLIMAGLKNLIVNSKAKISKRLGDGVMTQSRLEKNKEMIEDMDHAIKLGLRAEEIVYTFQLPHPRCNFLQPKRIIA